MKARLLAKLMNNCGYYPNNNEEYIAMGSTLCHDLISVNKKTLQIKYALDTFKQGRACLLEKDSKNLLFVWDKFQELIDSGQIHDIINGQDEIENPLPVYTFKDGALIKTFTDKYGWPNTTINGDVMYDNTHFKTEKEAVEKAIREYSAGVNIMQERVSDCKERLNKAEDLLKEYERYLDQFQLMKQKITA